MRRWQLVYFETASFATRKFSAKLVEMETVGRMVGKCFLKRQGENPCY
jgi:hypothetical protein